MQYSQKVLDHFMKPHNVGEIKDADAVATEGSPACGDQVTVYLKINEKTHIIEDIKFKSYGCASNIATGSMITDMAMGKTIDQALAITWRDAMEELDGLPPTKAHCSVLAADTLHEAVKNYQVKHGLRKVEDFSKETIITELKHVIYPQVGEDIVTLKMVKYVGFDDGVAIIDIEIPSFDKYRDNVAEEIREHLEKYEQIKDLQINM